MKQSIREYEYISIVVNQTEHLITLHGYLNVIRSNISNIWIDYYLSNLVVNGHIRALRLLHRYITPSTIYKPTQTIGFRVRNGTLITYNLNIGVQNGQSETIKYVLSNSRTNNDLTIGITLLGILSTMCILILLWRYHLIE